MRVTNQGGSLAGFLIIGALLALVLVGGLYGLNRYNAEKANEEVATSNESNNESASSEVKNEVKKETESEKSESTGRQTTGSTSSTPSSNQAPTASASQSNSGAAQTAQLPQTGPADTTLTIFALAFVTFAGTHFIRSRQQ